MTRPVSLAPRVLLLVAPLFALGACRSAGLAVYNLNEVHEPDGTPRRAGSLHGPIEHALVGALSFGDFGRPAFLEDDEAEEIDDPLGVCHANLASLLEQDLDDPVTLGLAVQVVTWLAGDCTYALSRERCAEALVPLGRRTGLTGPRRLPEGVEPIDAEAAAGLLAELLRAARPVLELEAFGLSGSDLEEACEAIRAATLDRDGARRILTVTNLLLRRQGFDAPTFAPVRALHEELATTCLGSALAALVEDPQPRVRAAAIDSWIRLRGGADPAPYRRAFEEDGSEEAVLAAVRGLARHGAPSHAAEDGGANPEEAWMGRLIPLLTRIQEGPLQVAACRAMARLTGREADLHPEVWVAYWDERRAARAAGAGGDAP